MPKRKHLTEKQEGFLSLTTRVEADLTQNERILLGYIIQSYREKSNRVEENGYVHASISTLKKECGLGQDAIKQAITKLVNEGLITCEVGRVKVHNTRLSLTEKAKKYIYVPIDVPIAEKVHDDTSNENEVLRLKINELTKDVENLTEEVKFLKKYIGIGLGLIPLFNSSCIHLSNLNNSTQNTIPDKSCSMSDEEKNTGSEYTQPDPVPYVFDERYFDSTPEPVKRKKKSSTVSSSLQIIEEENHPDTGDNDSSNDERTTADRLSSSQLDSKTQPQPLEKGKEYREVLSAVRQKLDSAVDELMEEESEKLFAKLSTKKSDEIPDDVKRLVYEKVSAIAEEHPDYYDTYKSVRGFKSWGELIKETVDEMCRRLVEKDPKSHVTAYSDFENNPIIVREAT